MEKLTKFHFNSPSPSWSPRGTDPCAVLPPSYPCGCWPCWIRLVLFGWWIKWVIGFWITTERFCKFHWILHPVKRRLLTFFVVIRIAVVVVIVCQHRVVIIIADVVVHRMIVGAISTVRVRVAIVFVWITWWWWAQFADLWFNEIQNVVIVRVNKSDFHLHHRQPFATDVVAAAAVVALLHQMPLASMLRPIKCLNYY